MMQSTTLWGSILLAFSPPLLQPLHISHISNSPTNLHHFNTFHLFAYVVLFTGSHLPSLHMLPCFPTSNQTPSPLPSHLPAPTYFTVSYSSLSPLFLLASSYITKNKPNSKPGFNVD